jgi:DNA-binding response OmpR family regulator
MRILVVEDDPRIVSFVQKGLADEGYQSTAAYDGDQAMREVSRGLTEYDVVLLDLGLPGISGDDVLAAIRRRAPHVPVIVLTARAELVDKVRGLDQGAADYVTKPFSFEELLARLRAVVRASGAQVLTTLRVDDLELDLHTKVATRDGRRIELTPREWSMLELFMRHPTHVVTRARLENEVFGYDFDAGSNIVDVYVGYLRRKLNASGERPFIKTVRGAGYRFVDAS